jgi:hypothetical protein
MAKYTEVFTGNALSIFKTEEDGKQRQLNLDEIVPELNKLSKENEKLEREIEDQEWGE